MTTQPDAPAASAGQAGGRPRRPIAAFDNYGDAERVVDYLSDNGFPVNRVAIIGSDVRMVEQIVGRMNYGGAALRGAGSGVVTGLLIGWLFAIFNWFTPVLANLTLIIYCAVFGAIIGAMFGLVVHALQGGRRDFASVRMVQRSGYEVVADEAVANQAKELLAKMEVRV